MTSLDEIITGLRNKGLTLGDSIFSGISKIHPSHGFNYTVTKEATCTASGTKTGTCNCGSKDIQSIAAIGHTYGDWVVSSDETTKTRTCSKCGNKETANITKVELKDADTATKSKYNFKQFTSLSIKINEAYSLSSTSSGGGKGVYIVFNSFNEITPSTAPVGSIIYIPNSLDVVSTNHCNKLYIYSIDKTGIIPAGYYKILKINNYSGPINGSGTTGGFSIIPFAHGYEGSWGGPDGSGGSITCEPENSYATLKSYIEYLGTSYKVLQ